MTRFSLKLLACTALLTPQMVWAQDGAPAEEAGGLEEIVVTAQKREEGLSRVPISIAAVSGDAIAEKGTANLEQLSSTVPNLRITQTGIANRIAIRGISSGDNKGFEQSAAMFVDGVYYGRDQLVRMPIVDVQRVEVLRGPQPTLFGKNAIAGAISIINRKPTDEFGGSLNASYEFEHKEAQVTGVINVPMGDKAGMRLVGYHRSMDGYMFNTTLNRDEPHVDTTFLRGTFALDDGPISATLKLEYADFKVLGQARENFSPRGTYSVSPFFSGVDTVLDWRSQNNGFDSKTKIFNSTLNVDVGIGSHTLNLTSGYVHYSAAEILDVDFTALPMLDGTNQDEKYDQLSQEVRLTSPNEGPLTYILGGYFQTSKLSANDTIQLGSFFQGLSGPFAAFRPLGDSRSVRAFRQTSTLWSGFAQATYALTEQLRLTAGVRFNHESKDGSRKLGIVAGSTNLFPITTIRAVWGAVRVAEHSLSGRISEDSTTPMANIQYDITDELMAYASYARGAKAGGFDIRSNAAPTHPTFPGSFIFRPEKADSFEGGLKYRSRNLSLAVSYYHTTYKDLQTSTFDGGIGFNVDNASAAKVQGIEAEARVAIGDHLQLSGALAYLDFKYTDWRRGQCPFGLAANVQPGNFCDYTGTRATFAPKWSGNAAADFNYPVGTNMKVSLNINADFSSAYRSGNVLDPFTDQAGFARIGARLGLGHIDDNWEIALVGRNLTNKRIVLTSGQLPLSNTLTGNTGTGYSGIFDRPRNIAVQFQGKF
ncbi:TonB-dependent receptor [Novosphingobium sp. B 225]|uniref:TonB-dependent receptor n=1 Tax=Novosphingobium sp. B 225 TaxID=1961849 RepID=UPI000B4AF87F|nr:TonB-dependent receptor [Novosphingobium sp. B 225]